MKVVSFEKKTFSTFFLHSVFQYDSNEPSTTIVRLICDEIWQKKRVFDQISKIGDLGLNTQNWGFGSKIPEILKKILLPEFIQKDTVCAIPANEKSSETINFVKILNKNMNTNNESIADYWGQILALDKSTWRAGTTYTAVAQKKTPSIFLIVGKSSYTKNVLYTHLCNIPLWKVASKLVIKNFVTL